MVSSSFLFLLVAVVAVAMIRTVDAFAGLHHVVEFHQTAEVMMHHSTTHAAFLQSGAAFVNQMGHAYQESLLQHPLYTKMITGGVLATTGDAIAQSRTSTSYDSRRAMSFMTFDMCYRALQHYAFPVIVATCHGQHLHSILDSTIPAATTINMEYLAAMERTLVSQLGIVPFMYYPIFYLLTAFVQNLTPQGAVNRAKETFLPLMQKNLKYWIPVQFIQFCFIDEHLQIPFLSAAGLCWTCILSLAAGNTANYKQPPVASSAAITTTEEEKQATTATVGAADYAYSNIVVNAQVASSL